MHCLKKKKLLPEKKNRLRFKKNSLSQSHNILKLFYVLPDFPYTINETMGDYYQ